MIFAAATLAVAFITAVTLCIQALNTQAVSAFSNGNMRIVVDAGHGGIDGGVTGRTTGVKESDLNLDISMALKERLEELGFEVVLTRKTEAGLYGTATKGFKKRDMQKRKEIIQNADPALVISIHQNFYPSKATRGGQVFYSQQSEEGKRLALFMQSRLNALYKGEGVKERNAAKGEYFMLECADSPSVIVECAFLSNAADEALVKKGSFQRELAASLAAGVLDFYEGENALL